jgi:hypothetical protein
VLLPFHEQVSDDDDNGHSGAFGASSSDSDSLEVRPAGGVSGRMARLGFMNVVGFFNMNGSIMMLMMATTTTTAAAVRMYDHLIYYIGSDNAPSASIALRPQTSLGTPPPLVLSAGPGVRGCGVPVTGVCGRSAYSDCGEGYDDKRERKRRRIHQHDRSLLIMMVTMVLVSQDCREQHDV